ncbi:PTS lactose/cellobiose transporter subunit IIA, partial [Clostridioides difficile]|nr:PTS lactose/cellobiose transporter subunit IIA [Clostridioides difficile]
TELIQKEAGGDKSDISILLIHSQDHLMTCMSERNLIKEMIMLRKEIQKLK